MAGRGGRNDDAIAKALGMIASMLGGNANGAGISANRQLAEFQRNNSLLIKGTHDPEGAQKWLKEIDRIFRVIDCAKNLKDVRGRKEIEFMELKQGNMTVLEYASKFVELAKYYTHYNNDEAGEFSKCIKFENGLRDEIKKGIRYQRIRRFADLVDCSKIFKEDNIKMKSSHSRELVDRKCKKHVDRGKPYGRGKAVDWRKPSGGDSSAFVRCYNCGEIGHRNNECKLDKKKCFKCDKVGHIVADLKKKVLFPKAINADDLAMTSRQVNDAVEDGATVFMLFVLMNLKEKAVSSELPVVCDFPEVFPEDVNELPPKREVDVVDVLLCSSMETKSENKCF
ncbi:uncharacterized protein LOC131634003 [Vicia villosa]|uniref:uncharacterized protein LOC131634003 n=1 Tax=Vicia villosa TaxID=3911 RepID=UPI00273B3014|nr:uncharacterized protein LOC131634003 [Vicia villosa]